MTTETDKVFNFGFSYSRFALEDTNSAELEKNHEDEIENNKSKENEGKMPVSFGFLLVGEESFKSGKSKLCKEKCFSKNNGKYLDKAVLLPGSIYNSV